MSDLSVPPMSTLPSAPSPAPVRAPSSASAPEPGRRARLDWPTPRLAGFPAQTDPVVGQPCEIEGLNGVKTTGRLIDFDLQAGLLQVQLPRARSITALRFEQFRRLRLLQPLPALAPAPGDDAAAALPQGAAVSYAIELRDGTFSQGLTLTAEETPSGIFLFEPVGQTGSVSRSFVPRAAFDQVEIGPRIGAALVAQRSITPLQVEQALAEQEAMRQRRVGELLLMRHIITPQELTEAIDRQSSMPMVRIGEALTALGFVTEAQLEDALAQQRSDRSVPLGELLVRLGLISRVDLQTALARKMGYPLVDVMAFPADAEAVSRLPYALAVRVPALPLMLRGGRLVVAVEDPSDHARLEELEFAAQCKVVPVLARSGVLGTAIDRAYEMLGAAALTLRSPSESAAPVEFELGDAGRLLATMESGADARLDESAEAPIEQSDNTLVRLINSMILEAHTQGVSDIHIECPPGREKVRIRFRKDGQLRAYLELPPSYRNALIGRIKIMCDLDISERRKPQDGKINFGKFVQGMRLELRVATIPTQGNLEDAVLRLLASSKPIPLDLLGLAPANLERLRALAERPYGMLLCVGPTGSGKTTTLHSVLGSINRPDRKIWTAEDPIEITQAGLRQVQVNPRIEWTFAKALRAFLRADPDVIMVGEIRDAETAQVAIEASLTGHLVLSTLHTNSAPETVTRLLDMGMDPFNFADALLGVLAQRLVRRLCTHCRSEREATVEEEEELLRDHLHALAHLEPQPDPAQVLAGWRRRFASEPPAGSERAGRLTVYRCAGCTQCNGSGYRGRAGIHELMLVSRPLRHLIQTGQRSDELLRHALGEGMRTLRQDGIEKVLAGVTSIEEVRANS